MLMLSLCAFSCRHDWIEASCTQPKTCTKCGSSEGEAVAHEFSEPSCEQAAYAARYVAKNVVAAGLATRCQVQLAYAIGVARPVSVLVETFGTGKVSDAEGLNDAVNKVFDLRPTAIIRDLDLRKPIYRKLAAYGHMGRVELGVKWEDTDRVDALLEAVKQ